MRATSPFISYGNDNGSARPTKPKLTKGEPITKVRVMKGELSIFEKKLIRALKRQGKTAESIVTYVKRRRSVVYAYLKELKTIKEERHHRWVVNEKNVAIKENRLTQNYKEYVNEIKPILTSRGLTLRQSGTLDIETGIWNDNHTHAKMTFNVNVLCVSYYDPIVGVHTFNTVKAALLYIIRNTTVKVVFAHNLRGFESLYLIDELNKEFDTITLRTQGKNANPFLIGCKKGDRFISFQDSYAIIPYPLADITSEKGFNTSTKKGDMVKGSYAPYYTIVEIKEYNRNDCISLHQALTIFEKEIKDTFDLPLKNTTSSLGFSIFKRHYLPEKIVIDNTVNKVLRDAYHGGAVQILSMPHHDKDVLIVEADINSSYPYAMLNPIPFPPYTTIKKPNVKIIFEKEGFSYGTITFPKYVKFPILTTKSKANKLIFPGGTFKGLFPHPSLRFAIERQGAEFIPEYTIVGTPQTYLKEFAKDLYEMRQKASKNKAKRYTYKILLNGAYGRWGISDELTTWIINNMNEDEWKNNDSTIDETYIPIKYKNPHSQAVVSVAAYITDYGRVNLWKYLYVLTETLPPENICYFDTDAIFYIPLRQPTINEWKIINKHENDITWLDKWIIKNNVNLRTGLECNDKLGSMKLELIGKRSDIITSKVYKVTELNGKNIYRAKGFNTPEVDTPVNRETWWQALKKGEPIEMRGLLTFVTSIHQQKKEHNNDMVRVKQEVTRQLRNAYDKREIVPLKNHPLLFATTDPIKLGGDKI